MTAMTPAERAKKLRQRNRHAPNVPFGTVAHVSHDDFKPDLRKGTEVVILRRHPDPEYDYEIAFIDAKTKAAKITAINYVDLVEIFDASGTTVLGAR